MAGGSKSPLPKIDNQTSGYPAITDSARGYNNEEQATDSLCK
jgi:hypothetical protein